MTNHDQIDIAIAAMRLYAETHPRPPHVTQSQAAEMLGLSAPTGRRRSSIPGDPPMAEIMGLYIEHAKTLRSSRAAWTILRLISLTGSVSGPDRCFSSRVSRMTCC